LRRLMWPILPLLVVWTRLLQLSTSAACGRS
jgi:hypothetical protein